MYRDEIIWYCSNNTFGYLIAKLKTLSGTVCLVSIVMLIVNLSVNKLQLNRFQFEMEKEIVDR